MLAIALFVPSIVEAGPWVADDPGHGYASLSFSEYQASQYFTGPGQPIGGFAVGNYPYGKREPISISTPASFSGAIRSKYTDQSAVVYGEVSLWKHIGFVLSMPVFRHISQDLNNGNVTNNGAGDLVLGLKYQLPIPRSARGLALGVQAYLTTPTGNQNGRGTFPAADSIPTDNKLPLPTGNGTVDIEPRISAGYSFYPIPVFVIAELGYHHHFNDSVCSGIPNDGAAGTHSQHVTYSDDLPWSVQIGGTYQPKKHVKGFDHLTVIGVLHGDKSLENGFIDHSAQNLYERPCGQANNSTYFNVGGQLMFFFIKYFGVTYSIEHTITGGNTGYGLTNTVGLATSF